MTRCFAAALAVVTLVVWPAAASAQQAKIEVDTDDNPLVIRGFTADAAGFQGTMRLTATGNVGTFRTLFSPLRARDDPALIIERSHLSLIGTTSLADGDIVDVQVKVDGVSEPGTYEGKVELIPSGEKRADGQTVPITLEATARPALSPVAKRDKVSGDLTKCGLLGCDAAGWLVPGDAGPKERSIDFTLGKSQTATVKAINLFADGEKNGHQLTSDDLGLKPPYKSVNQALSLPTTIDPAKLGADHYTGTMNLTVENVDAPVVVPVDFSVRDEPLAALILLGVGVVLGYLWRLFKGDGTKLLNLYRQADLLEWRVNNSSTVDKTKALAEIAEARVQVGANHADEAKKTLDAVAALLTAAGEGEGSDGATGRVPAAGSRGPFWRSERFLRYAWIAGGIAVGALLVITGFQTQYVNKGTFGAGDVWDYFPLLAWGFAAGLAGRAVGTSGSGGITG